MCQAVILKNALFLLNFYSQFFAILSFLKNKNLKSCDPFMPFLTEDFVNTSPLLVAAVDQEMKILSLSQPWKDVVDADTGEIVLDDLFDSNNCETVAKQVSDVLEGDFKQAIARFYIHPDLDVSLNNNVLKIQGLKVSLRANTENMSVSINNSFWHPQFVSAC